MNDDIVTKLEFLLKEGAAIIKDQADEIERLRKAGDVMAEWVAVDHSIEQCIDGCEYLTALQDWKEVRRA